MKPDNVKKGESIVDLKNHPSVIAYLGFLQDVISRMGGNSSNIKSLIAVVYTIFVTILIAIKELNAYWWVRSEEHTSELQSRE